MTPNESAIQAWPAADLLIVALRVRIRVRLVGRRGRDENYAYSYVQVYLPDGGTVRVRRSARQPSRRDSDSRPASAWLALTVNIQTARRRAADPSRTAPACRPGRRARHRQSTPSQMRYGHQSRRPPRGGAARLSTPVALRAGLRLDPGPSHAPRHAAPLQPLGAATPHTHAPSQDPAAAAGRGAWSGGGSSRQPA